MRCFFSTNRPSLRCGTLLKFAVLQLVALSVCVGFAQAAPEQRELKSASNEKVDAVLLLDDSGSMLQTDPGRLRDEGAKLFLQFLRPGDRIAVIQFDREAKVVRPFVEFKSEEVQSIASDISKIEASGLYTDLLAGVQVAGDLLKKEKREDASGIIVLLSDGKMEPDPSIGQAYSRTEDLLNVLLPELKAGGIKIHTLALSEKADRQLLSEIAVGTEGIAWYAPDADKIHQSYADLFLAVKKPQVLPLTSKGFSIDADVQEATFYVNREESAEVSLVSPDGKEIRYGQQGDNIKWFRGQSFDVITIVKPEAGDWRLKGLVTSDGFATVLTNLKLVSDWPSSIIAGEPTILQARLNEGEKPVVLKEMSGATRYALQILPTDKVAEPIVEDVLYDDGSHGDKIANDGIFSYKVNIPDPGDFKIWIVAKGPTFDRRQQIPFRVKPPLVSVRVVSEGEEDVAPEADHEHGNHEAPAEGVAHEGEGHPVASSEEPAKESSAAAHQDNSKDRIEVELSQDVAVYKNIKAKLIAIDSEKRRFNLPIERMGDDLHYEASASALPHSGTFELQAEFVADSKKHGSVHEASKTIKYSYAKAEAAEATTEFVIDTKEKPVEDPSGIPHALLVLIVDLAIGAGLIMQLKRNRTQESFTLPTFESPELALAGISGLEARNALQEIDLGDPIFENEVVLPPSGGSSRAAPPPSPAAAAKEEPSETSDAPEEDAAAEEEPGEAESESTDEEPKE